MGSHMAITETPEQVANPPRIYTMTAADRCDQCGARAYVRATMHSLSELTLCGHHGREHEATLRPAALDWLDETEALNVRLDVSP